jgi:hypothetical protein
VITRLIEGGTIAPDADAAKLASGIPSFSRGTLPLDPNTRKPIGDAATEPGQPTFTEGGVAVEGDKGAQPVGGDAPGGIAGSGKSAEELLAEHRQRIAEGTTPGAAPPQAAAATAEPATAATTPAQQQGAAAAEAVAAQIADAWAEYDEFEFEDPDLEVKIPVRVPKQFAATAKRGYGRRAAYDREMSWLKNAEALKPLVLDGRLNAVLPLIERALEDPAYGEYVTEGFRRAQQGLPLRERAALEAAAAGAVQAGPQAPAPIPELSEIEATDPFLAEQLRPVLSQFQTLQQRLDAQEAQRQQQEQRQREEQQRQAEIANQMIQAHRTLAQMYPDKVRLDLGAQDPFWQKASRYAGEAGYTNAWGIAAGIVFGAQKVAEMEQERVAATASPAAAALTTNEASLELARRQAAAASRTVGAGSATQAPPPVRPQPPSTKRPDGTMKSPAEFLAEQQAYLAAVGGA